MDRKTYYSAIALFSLIGMVFAIYFLPTSEDIAWMQYYDRKFESSSQAFEELYIEDAGSKEALVPSVWLDLQFANVDEAVQTVEGHVWDHPDDVEARLYLGTLYLKAGRKFDYVRNLEELYELNPKVETLVELNTAYKELDNLDGRQQVLKALVEKGAATVKDYQTLAYLYASKNENVFALAVIEKMVDRFNVETFDETTILFTVGMLLDFNEVDPAFVIAVKYANLIKKPKVILSLAYEFVDDKQFSEAELLAKLLPEKYLSGKKGKEFQIVLALAREDKMITKALIEKLLAQGNIPEKFLAELTIFTLDNREFDLFNQIFKIASFEGIKKQDLFHIVGLLLENKREGLAELLKEKLQPQDPVLLLGLELTIGGKEKKEQLEKIEWDSFTSDDLVAVAGYLYLSGDDKLSKEVYGRVNSFQEVDPNSLDVVVERMIAVGSAEKARSLLSSYKVPLGFNRDPYLKAQLYLLAVSGDIDELKARIQALGLASPSLYRSLIAITEQVGQKKVALAIAETLVALQPTPENRELYALTLAWSGKSEKALNIILGVENLGKDVSFSRLKVLGYATENDPSYQTVLDEALSEYFAKEHNLLDVRALSYFFLDRKMKREAEPFFKVLSEGRGWSDPDFQTLLYIWGVDLSDEQLAFVLDKSKDAEGSELKGFGEFLLYNKYPKEALTLLERNGWEDSNIAPLYLEALKVEGERDRMEEVIAYLLPITEGKEELMKLGDFSVDIAVWKLAKIAYTKVLDLDSEYPPALKGMGIASYSQGFFRQSISYFCHLNSVDPYEYQSWYTLGNILTVNGHHAISKKYYWRALRLMQSIKELGPFAHSTEAQIYFRLRHPDRSVRIYKNLINPIVKTTSITAPFKSDYADMLINLERYCAAERALQPSKDDGRDKLQLFEKNVLEVNDAVVKIRLLQETGRYREAFAEANRSLVLFPDEPRIYASYANLELASGRWQKALNWLEHAYAIEPGNDNYARPWRLIQREKGSSLQLGREDKLTGAFQYEQLHEALLFKRFNRLYSFELGLRADHMRIFNVPDLKNGGTFKFDGDRLWAEFRNQFDIENGMQVDVSAYVSHLTPGFGVQLFTPNAYGDGWIRLRYHRPTYDFVQTVILYGVEDRIDLYKSIKLGPRVVLFGGGGMQRYHLETFWNAAETYTYQGGIVYRIPKTWPLAWALGDEGIQFLNYFVDAQIATKEKRITDVFAQEVTPFAIEDRETHNLTYQLIKRFTPCIQADGYFGVTYDRFTGGPFAPIYGLALNLGKQGFMQGKILYTHTVSTQFATEATDRFVFQLVIPY